MDPGTPKARENRLRRAAVRRGLRVRKCPRRDVKAVGYGMWELTDSDGAPVDPDRTGFSFTLDEVSARLELCGRSGDDANQDR